ncbi:MAG: KH domain-containing protein [Bacteroidota bacterium]
MKDFLEFIAKHLVDHPDMVRVELEEKDNKAIFKLSVGEEDVGKVIGRKGRTAQAMRTLLAAVAAKEGKRAILEIND